MSCALNYSGENKGMQSKKTACFSYLKKMPSDVLLSKVDLYFPKMLTLTKKSNMFQN